MVVKKLLLEIHTFINKLLFLSNNNKKFMSVMKKLFFCMMAVLAVVTSCNRLELPDDWQERNAEVLQNKAFKDAVQNIDKDQIWVADGGIQIAGMTVAPITDGTRVSINTLLVRGMNLVTTPADYFRILWGPNPSHEIVVRVEEQGNNVTEWGLYYYTANDVRIEKPLAATGSSKIGFAGNADTDCFGVYIVKNGKKIYSESRYNDGLKQVCSYVAQGDQKELTSNRAYIYLSDVVFKINSNDDIIGLDYDRGPWMVICEDCGTQADNDFNDVVFIVHRLDATHIKLEYCATGASLLDYVHFKTSNLGEIHDIMGIEEGKMVNVHHDIAMHPYSTILEVSKDFTMTSGNYGGFCIICNGIPNLVGDVLTRGYAPYMVVVPAFMNWCVECTPIFSAYPEFIFWAQDHTKCVDWFMHPVTELVVY